MNARKLLGLALLVMLAGCAPVGPEPSATEGPDAAEQAPAPDKAQPPAAVATEGGLRRRIELAVQNVRERELRTSNGFWTVFHGILGLGPGVALLDEATGKKVNAVEYICRGGELRGLQFVPTEWGLDVVSTPGLGTGQGHQDQFIAEMAQWGMPPDQRFRVLGKRYTYADFIRHCQMRASVKEGQELSWAILVIGQYLGTDIEWENGKGEKLRYDDLIRYELDAPMAQAACGGTHRLFDLAWVHHLHVARGGKTEGVWKEVAAATRRYRDLARKYQNPDGSFSTDFFNGPGNAADKQRRINTTGHILEWLALALPTEELKEQWVQDAANALSVQILDLAGQLIEGGSVYHAVHGLLIYYARVFDRKTLGPPELLFPLPPGESPPLPKPVPLAEELLPPPQAEAK